MHIELQKKKSTKRHAFQKKTLLAGEEKVQIDQDESSKVESNVERDIHCLKYKKVNTQNNMRNYDEEETEKEESKTILRKNLDSEKNLSKLLFSNKNILLKMK